jgi:hypothetical protein
MYFHAYKLLDRTQILFYPYKCKLKKGWVNIGGPYIWPYDKKLIIKLPHCKMGDNPSLYSVCNL